MNRIQKENLPIKPLCWVNHAQSKCSARRLQSCKQAVLASRASVLRSDSGSRLGSPEDARCVEQSAP